MCDGVGDRDHSVEAGTRQVVAGTIVYINLEFVNTQMRSTESDLYIFGVVHFQIACSMARQRKEPLPCYRIMSAAYNRGAVLDAAKRRLEGALDEHQTKYV